MGVKTAQDVAGIFAPQFTEVSSRFEFFKFARAALREKFSSLKSPKIKSNKKPNGENFKILKSPYAKIASNYSTNIAS